MLVVSTLLLVALGQTHRLILLSQLALKEREQLSDVVLRSEVQGALQHLPRSFDVVVASTQVPQQARVVQREIGVCSILVGVSVPQSLQSLKLGAVGLWRELQLRHFLLPAWEDTLATAGDVAELATRLCRSWVVRPANVEGMGLPRPARRCARCELVRRLARARNSVCVAAAPRSTQRRKPDVVRRAPNSKRGLLPSFWCASRIPWVARNRYPGPVYLGYHRYCGASGVGFVTGREVSNHYRTDANRA
eukprot:scaffold955_cov250-Pinguiococcus_pyrenoidosus.AAC.4